MNSKRWIGIYVLPFIIIGSFLHFIIYGNLVVDEFGWIFYLITLAALLWSNLFIITWIAWFVLAQYYHIYKFTEDRGQLRIGITNKVEDSFFQKILKTILPRRTEPRLIQVDIFNVDGLGGLNPLAQLSLSGTVLTGIVLAVFVPVIIVANSTAALFLVPLSFFIIITGYVIGISSLRDAIRMEKNNQLSKINTNLTKLAEKLIEHSDIDHAEANIENLQTLNEKFTILETLGNKINDIPESPTSLKAFIRIGSSSVLPLISFISVDQIGLFL